MSADKYPIIFSCQMKAIVYTYVYMQPWTKDLVLRQFTKTNTFELTIEVCI